jgi:tRNA A37 methylthiotransferase MiaB
VDYNVIPLLVTEGCLYHCRFCRVKDNKPFQQRPTSSIADQIRALKAWFGPDRVNFNALFLGGSDALAADGALLRSAVERAVSELGLDRSYMRGLHLFLFGSVDSFLAADAALFDAFQAMDCRTYINIGLESADPETLDAIGKPITARQVKTAFDKMREVNRRFSAIEVTANFLMDDSLPTGHYPAFIDLVRGGVSEPSGKGTIYLSPMCLRPPSQHSLYFFNQLQAMSRLPVFLYLIQRL